MSDKATSDHVRAAAKLRYPAESHALLFEVANSTGSSTRRFADAVAIGLWPSHGHEIEGIEIKVSRSDWLRERADAEKSQPVFQFCHRWWVACPKGMIEVDELPPTWGLLELVGEVLRVKHKAPKLSPIKPSMGFVASLLRRHAGADEEMSRLIIRREVELSVAAVRTRLEREHATRVHSDAREVERGIERLEKIKEKTGIDLAEYCPDERWIEAITFMTKSDWGVAFSATGLRNLRDNLRRVALEIDALPGVLPPVEALAVTA